MWDIKEFQDKLKSNKKASKPSFTEAGKENPVAVDDRERGIETPFVKYITVSSIEASHKMAISDVRWLAKSMEVSPAWENPKT
ncbi:MAG: hypothetical protein BJ554DRAFT_6124 [Olpidium bornovanus]|uniref:Uncharacterized protein n=1 Tax=Olpidium bornovanus TaxID=278681 RepID=A0A8H8DKY3_9FUNG|nr:MAG: hypothetical protein BJ554DRAFT_6124 [Olpidium bornovanus]